MRKSVVILFTLFLFLTGCGNTEPPSASQPEAPSSQVALPELEKVDWPAVSTDAEAFDLTGGLENPNFEYVFDHTETVPLDQLVAFALVSDALSEGACEELRSRFLEAPNTVLAYLVLMGTRPLTLGIILPRQRSSAS